MFNPSAWFTKEANPLDLFLDAENARLELDPKSPQSWIRKELCEHEDIIELAKSINEFGGLYPSDNIIVCVENDQLVTLEGNRRVCALQLFLDPDLIPTIIKKRFPSPAEGLLELIETVPVEVAPSRAEADVLIARLHAIPAKKAWQPLAKMRYAERLYEQNFTVSDIAANLSESKSQIRRLVRRYRIYKHALSLNWSDAELGRLRDERLKVTGYVRIFEKNDARNLIGDIFDNEGAVVSEIDPNMLEKHLKKMVQDFLLPGPDGANPPENTRTNLSQYLKEKHAALIDAYSSTKVQYGATKAPQGKGKASGSKNYSSTAGNTQYAGPAPAPFFENMQWVIDDDNKLVRLCYEARKIRYQETPMAASMLVRALLEASLRYHLKKAKKYSQYQSQHGKNDTLQNLIKFCANTKNHVFTEKKVARQLQSFQDTGIKDKLDCVIHNNFGDVTSNLLTSFVRPYCRPIIEHIVKNEENL